VHGVASDDLGRTLEPLIGAPLVVLAQSERDAWRCVGESAARLQPECGSTLAGRLLSHRGGGAGDEIATSDPPLAAAARKEGFVVIALPDSTGRRP